MSILSDSLFRAVETEQGYAFISDGLDNLPDADILAIARGSLYHSRRVVRHLESWLNKHDDGSTRRLVGAGSAGAAVVESGHVAQDSTFPPHPKRV